MRPAAFGVSSISVLALTALITLAACDNGPSAVATRERDSASATYASNTPRDSGYDRRDRSESRGEIGRREAADDSSAWAASRKHTGAENAAYHFERDGESFGARSVDDYVSKARAFIDKPPRGAETLSRPNGDTLVYDAASNTFAVATKAGEPRAMFKPRDGKTYWDEQKDRETQRQASRGNRDRDEG